MRYVFCNNLNNHCEKYVQSEIDGQEVVKDLVQLLKLNEVIDEVAKTNSVRWYVYVFRKDRINPLRRALDFIVKGTRKRVRPKKIWLKANVEQSR